VTRGRLIQTAGSLGLNGGGAARTVPELEHINLYELEINVITSRHLHIELSSDESSVSSATATNIDITTDNKMTGQ